MTVTDAALCLIEDIKKRDAEITTLKALIIRTVKSGLLCDPGCCGDDCVCDELREVAKGE